MKLDYDPLDLVGNYDRRNLEFSLTGKHKYPSKKMFVEFLKKFPDIKATASIWSLRNYADSTVTINVEVKYKAPNFVKELCFSCEKVKGFSNTPTRKGKEKKEVLRFMCKKCLKEAEREYELEMKYLASKLEKKK